MNLRIVSDITYVYVYITEVENICSENKQNCLNEKTRVFGRINMFVMLGYLKLQFAGFCKVKHSRSGEMSEERSYRIL